MYRQPICFALILLLTSVVGCAGQRYITVRIDKDGTTLLQCEGGVPDSWSAARIWQRLDDKTFRMVAKFDADAANPKQATLTGNIKITIHHTTNLMASATVSTLQLVRVQGQTDEWRLPVAEVKRTATAAGF